MENEIKLKADCQGTAYIGLYEISYESKEEPSKSGLGYTTHVCAVNEKQARELFENQTDGDAAIIEVVDMGENAIIPMIRLEEPDNMTLNEYQEKAMTTCMETSNNFGYMFLNLVGEVGEFASKVAKWIRKDRASFYGSTKEGVLSPGCDLMYESENGEDEELKKEAGDILWQLSGLCSVMGWTMEEVAEMNLEKLQIRQANHTIDGSGDGNTAEEGRK